MRSTLSCMDSFVCSEEGVGGGPRGDSGQEHQSVFFLLLILYPGARAFAMDTRSKRRWDSPPLTPEVAQAFREACANFGYSPDHIIPHGSYLINLGSADPEMLAKSYAAFIDELQRCELLVCPQ
jgi:endonuclease IV